ncbi:MAG: NADH:flavin oxidoreductase [Acidobacteria bacterium]|nr:NADH:flavin oxidoreductase [Acidobacteriota bacterium]
MSRSLDLLFSSFRFGAATLPSRIVMAPMTRSKSPGGVPTAKVAAYYRRRAEGGVGLIITEGTVIEHKASNGYPDVPRMYGADALAGWKRVVDEVHEAGGVIIPQLWHVGSYRKRGTPPDPDVPGYGPSAVPHPAHGDDPELPVAMSLQDIAEVVGAFAAAAGNARELGFDGVEIHGAHSYLIDQFLWERTNLRTDEYGGSPERRLRLAVEVVTAVREAVGPGFPIQFRFSQWKMGHYRAKLAATPEALERLLIPLVEAGVDVFHASTRRYSEPEFPGSELNLAGWTQRLTGRPTITVGSVGLDSDFLSSFRGRDAAPMGIDDLLARLEREEFSLVAVGRALLADAHWPRKLHEGREDEIVPFTPECMERLE